MKIGFRTHDLGVKGAENAANKCKEMGIDSVQVVAYKFIDDIKYSVGQITDEKAKAIGKAFSDANVDVALVGAYFNPVHSKKEKVENGIGVFKDYLTYCKTIGVDMVGSETGSYNDDKWTYNPLNRTDEALSIVIDTFSSLADYASELGVNIGMEGAAGHVCYDVKTLKKAVDAINRPNVKVIFDIYNYLDSSNHTKYLDILEEGLNVFAGKIAVFHIKDYVFDEVNNKVKQVAPGKGVFDFKAILSKIKAYDKDAYLILEGTSGDDIVPSTAYIRKVWEEV